MVKLCIVIPVYNHPIALESLVSDMMPIIQGIADKVFLIDDGSDLATKTVLARLSALYPLVTVETLSSNQGKGAAVMHGFFSAFANGYSHVLQIDADYQHAPQDIPKFYALAQQNPDAIIAGKPIYDESVPKSRLYGRYITHFFVWLETCSFAIKDSMCGFRVYPLAPTLKVLKHYTIAQRMAFDIDIIVKLFWFGVPVISFATPVTYPLDGISHFDVFRDNCRISLVHAKLWFSSWLKIPKLLKFAWLRRRDSSRSFYS